MIALVLAMVWHRRGQAVTLALLALLAVTAAVAAPAYLRAADRAVASGQAATATGPERTLALTQTQPDLREPPAQGERRPAFLDQSRSALLDLPGFEYVYAAEFPAVGIEPDTHHRTLVVHRQNVCAHLVMVSGRCLVGEADVVLGVDTAGRLGLRAGDSVTLIWAFYNRDLRIYEPAGVPKRFLVAGVYRVPAPDDDYWGDNGYFSYGDRVGEPAFIGAASLAAMDRGTTRLSIDGIARPGALAVDRLPALNDRLGELRAQVTTLGAPVEMETGIPDLLDRIDRGRAAAHLIVPVLATALVLLACLTIFLAVGQSAEARRPEIAVVALRGARAGHRWWLATGESLVAIAAGAVAGCVAGQLLVNAVAAARFPEVGADPSLTSLRYAPVAALAALLTAVLAQVRQLRGAAGVLLRRAPAAPSGAAAVPVAVAVLAVAAGVQLAVSGGTLTGIGTFAAGLITIAAAQLAARAVLPVVTRYATRALRTGRLGLALAAFPLSRRPGATRLFALLVAAVAVIGYATCAVDVGWQGRTAQAGIGTGADRVLSLGPVGRRQLLSAVRAADPQGRYAMAVIRLPTERDQPAGLAVDSTRLAAVASWPAGGPASAPVAAALRPPAAEPVTIAGPGLALDLSGAGLAANKPVGLTVVLSAPDGRGDVAVPLGNARNGRHTYRRTVALCQNGCLVKALRFIEGEGISAVTGSVTVHGIGNAGPDSRLGDPDRWRADPDGAVAAAPSRSNGPDGLSVDVTALNGIPDTVLLQPADTPAQLPAATAGPAPERAVNGLDGRAVPIVPVHRLPAVPGAGAPATLIDLEYAERRSIEVGQTDVAEVWLSDRAPPDVARSLEARGLVVTADTRATAVRERLDRQGPALALWFFVLAGCLAAALAAGALVLAAAVDRDRLVEDLSALRVQGVSRAVVARATLWTYPALVAAAVLVGLPIALLAWWTTGWALPLAGLDPPPLPLPRWPRPAVLALVAVAVLAVLAAVGRLAVRRIR